MRCAPRELATADANLDFAEKEIADGNPGRAQEHLALAEQSARKASDLSRDCVQKVEVKKEAPRPVIIKKVQDTDGDGIPDEIDRCPLDAEDKDGFQDEDGCPDADNDGDYDETMALIAELDHVVTVTTTVAHVCGAMGKRAYVLQPRRIAARWRCR